LIGADAHPAQQRIWANREFKPTAYLSGDLGINIDWFKDLRAIEQTGSFSQASLLRNISQPALTRRIKALELWAEQPLVERGSRPVSLTETGKALLAICLEFFETLEHQRQELRTRATTGRQRIIRFTAQHSIAWHFFPGWLRELEMTMGPISSRMRAEDLAECVASFVDEEVDFLLAYDVIEAELFSQLPRSVESMVIGRDKLMPVCAPRADGHPVFDCDGDYAVLPLIRYGGDSPLGKLFDRTIAPRLKDRNTETIYENSMSGTLLNWTLRGAGVCWLPHRFVQADIEQGRLVLASQSDLSVDLRISIFRKSGTRFGLVNDIWRHLHAQTPVN
jgi:DNA-binding transcriptional LysR family regulator